MTEVQQWIATTGRLLGAIFYYEPNVEQVRSIISFFHQPNWADEWGIEVSSEIQSLVKAEPTEQQFQALFLGPNDLPAPPWSSVYLDPESVIFGNSLLALREFLSTHQITALGKQGEPEDHFGLMLMLAAYIAETKPDLLNEYLSQHLLPWSTHFLTLFAQNTNVPFYQGIALLAKETLAIWQDELDLNVKDVQFYR